jgi:hypothetical protein
MTLVRMTASGIALVGGSTFAILTIVRKAGWSAQLGAMAALCVIVLLGSMLIEVRSQRHDEGDPWSSADSHTSPE